MGTPGMAESTPRSREDRPASAATLGRPGEALDAAAAVPVVRLTPEGRWRPLGGGQQIQFGRRRDPPELRVEHRSYTEDLQGQRLETVVDLLTLRKQP